MTTQKPKKNIVQNLADMYFQGIANDISSAHQISAMFSHMGDRGDVRENVLMNFLKSHLPPRSIIAKGGCIFDSDGNESKQIDIFIASDSSLRFSYFDRDNELNKNIQTIEGCLAAISVKSTLNKLELTDALHNLASIPFMPQDILENVSHHISGREMYLNFPLKVVFAFTDGANVNTTVENINEFYTENQYDERQKAHLIIVNNSYCIERASEGGEKTRDGTVLKRGTYHPMHNRDPKKFGALPLLRLLLLIQNHCNWAPHVILKYQKYFDAMNFHG